MTCGGGIQTLTRTCTNPSPSNGGKNCSGLGPSEEEVSCNDQECRKLCILNDGYIASLGWVIYNKRCSIPITAINGGYSDWLECTECNVTCGEGTKILTRTCTNPPPANGGKDCSGLGPAVKKDSCNEQECRECLFITIIIEFELTCCFPFYKRFQIIDVF